MHNWPLWHWHIENSSICSLRCCRCPRNEIPDSLVQTSLELSFFKRNFDAAMLDNVLQISFCGDDGDPIYGKEFVETVEYLKFSKPNLSLRIVTNGSHKPTAWWRRLAESLNQFDEIHFSLDGWDQTSNEKYRANSKWESILSAVMAVRSNSDVVMTWAAIAFSFNQDQLLSRMESNAYSLGFDRYQVTLSTKFGSKYENYYTDGADSLEPQSSWIASGHRFERIVKVLTDRQQLDNGKSKLNDEIWERSDLTKSILPMCQIGNKGLYISSQGYFYPCCWMANRYNHTRWQQFRTHAYDLNKRTIQGVLTDPMWKDFFSNLHNHSECVNKCSSHNYSKEYATSW